MNLHPFWIIREKLAEQYFRHLSPKYRVLAVESTLYMEMLRRERIKIRRTKP